MAACFYCDCYAFSLDHLHTFSYLNYAAAPLFFSALYRGFQRDTDWGHIQRYVVSAAVAAAAGIVIVSFLLYGLDMKALPINWLYLCNLYAVLSIFVIWFLA